MRTVEVQGKVSTPYSDFYFIKRIQIRKRSFWRGITQKDIFIGFPVNSLKLVEDCKPVYDAPALVEPNGNYVVVQYVKPYRLAVEDLKEKTQ